MKLQIWFDFTCPFSYIGITKFIDALDSFSHKKDVRISFKSYSIAPYINETLNVDAHQYLATHKDISYERAKQFNEHIVNKFKSEGFNFEFDKLIPTTSRKAHNIFKMIDDECAQRIYIKYVFKAHFEEGKDISSKDVLVEIGKNVGLNEEDIIAVYDTEMYSGEVNNDYQKAEMYNLHAVPVFVIDEKYFLMGSHPAPAYLEMLDDFYRKSLEITQTEFCEDGSCAL